MYIVLPVLVFEEPSERDEDLGLVKDVKTETIDLSINLNHIVSHFIGTDGLTHITLADSREHISEIVYEEFLDILDDCYVRVEFNMGVN